MSRSVTARNGTDVADYPCYTLRGHVCGKLKRYQPLSFIASIGFKIRKDDRAVYNISQ